MKRKYSFFDKKSPVNSLLHIYVVATVLSLIVTGCQQKENQSSSSPDVSWALLPFEKINHANPILAGPWRWRRIHVSCFKTRSEVGRERCF